MRGNEQPPADEGEPFGPYILYERLGTGGMATVHRALEQGIAGFQREVALKRLLPDLAQDEDFVAAFVREAKLAALLSHANIVKIFELGRVGESYFISMEYIPGSDVRKILKQARGAAGPPPLTVVVSLLSELCDALDYAHNRVAEREEPLGLVHRDISPSNLLVSSAGHLKIIDFGIAKATSLQLRTQSGRIKGKLSYMAPEAIAGDDLDARSDIFSAGVIAHELLTATPLFASKQDVEVIQQIQKAEVSPPGKSNPRVPEELDALVLKALARDPKDRWQSAAEMGAALEELTYRYHLHATDREVVEWTDWAFSLGASDPPGDRRAEGQRDASSASQGGEPPSPSYEQTDGTVQSFLGAPTGETDPAAGVGGPTVPAGEIESNLAETAPSLARAETQVDDVLEAAREASGRQPTREEAATTPSAPAPEAEPEYSEVPTVYQPREGEPEDSYDEVPTVYQPREGEPEDSYDEVPTVYQPRDRQPTPASQVGSPQSRFTSRQSVPPIPTPPAQSFAHLVSFRAPDRPDSVDELDAMVTTPSTENLARAIEEELKPGPARAPAAPAPAPAPKEDEEEEEYSGRTVEKLRAQPEPKRAADQIVRLGAVGILLAAAAFSAALYVRGRSPEQGAAPAPTEPARLHLIVEPEDAQVLVDGVERHSPLELAPGIHEVRVQREGYRSWITEIEVAPGETQTVRIALEEGLGGRVQLGIQSTPPGLLVTVDGERIERKTPLVVVVEPGEHVITLSSERGVLWRERIDAEPNTQYSFHPVLWQAAPLSPPEGAGDGAGGDPLEAGEEAEEEAKEDRGGDGEAGR